MSFIDSLRSPNPIQELELACNHINEVLDYARSFLRCEEEDKLNDAVHIIQVAIQQKKGKKEVNFNPNEIIQKLESACVDINGVLDYASSFLRCEEEDKLNDAVLIIQATIQQMKDNLPVKTINPVSTGQQPGSQR